MSKNRKNIRNKKKRDDNGMPLIVLVSIAGSTLLGYFIGEFAFYARPHPVHWASALVLALFGFLVGKIIYRYYGDIL
jgi:hypothetical protein